MARRRLLQGAGLAAGGAVVGGLATSSPVHADGNNRHNRAEGSWLLTRFDPSDGVERTFVFILAQGGVCAMNDISPVFITALGAWKAHGRRVRATIWVGTEETEEGPAVAFKVDTDSKIRGDEMVGTFAYVVFLPDLTTQVGEGGGTFEGTRITV